MNIKIVTVTEHTTALEQVIKLGDKNNGTLGFYPRGAFEQAASRRQILAAATSDGIIAGYLLYRIIRSKSQVSITHLCIDETYRGKGIARQLVEYLKSITNEWRGIGLFSRRDYNSNSFWPNVGFVYKGEKPGRGKDQIPLSYYWYEHGHPSLIRLVNEEAISAKNIKAVIDANVFFDLQDNPQHPLLVDWLLEDVAICITPELFNEINRNTNARRRQANLRYAQTLPEVQTKSSQVEQIFEVLGNQFSSERIQDESDLKQLAYAIAADADFFITRDVRWVDQAREEIFREFGIMPIRPEDLIIYVDELMDATSYQPSRLAGTQIEIKRVGTGQSNDLATAFHVQSGEKKVQLAEKLRKYLAHPDIFEVDVAQNPLGEPLAIIVVERKLVDTLDIPLIRINSSPLAAALVTQLIFRNVAIAVQEGRRLVRLTESNLSKDVVQSLIENSFEINGDVWIKFNLIGAYSCQEVDERLKELEGQFPAEKAWLDHLYCRLHEAAKSQDVSELIKIERALWPLKLIETDIPTFIVSIRPSWAIDLFDYELGNQTLFGSDPSLMFKMENVYYRSANTKLPTAPSRVLWYISKPERMAPYRAMTIKACSYVDEVVIGTPKDLFKRFSRLGVYKWRDVFEEAKNDVNKSILAFRFSRTELFENPVSLETMKKLLDRKLAPISPIRISDSEFQHIYKIGCRLNNGEENVI